MKENTEDETPYYWTFYLLLVGGLIYAAVHASTWELKGASIAGVLIVCIGFTRLLQGDNPDDV
jgi:hypothetical protein